MIVQGRDYGNGKRVGLRAPARLRRRRRDHAAGEWGGNTFYITVEGALDVYVREARVKRRSVNSEQGACFGEMGLLAGIGRNATVAVPGIKSRSARSDAPALRLLRKLTTFGNILDETYRTHGIGRVLEDLRLLTDKPLSEPLAAELRRTARYMVYGKNHGCAKKASQSDRLILIKKRLGATFSRCFL